MRAMLEAKNISYGVNGKKILDGVSFRMERGEFVGLLGPNGAGKTTLLKILGGVIRHYEGTATLNLIHLKAMKPRGLAQFIATVPQENHFAFPFSALEIVLMGRQPHRRSFSFDSEEDLQIARVAMDRTDCRQFSERTIDTLSGGEKQRVLLARAMAQKPAILLLDEPATHLDLAHTLSLFQLLSELNKGDRLTILCVVHDLNLASRFCKRVLVLKEGRLALEGEGGAVLQDDRLEGIFGVSFERHVLPDGRLFLNPKINEHREMNNGHGELVEP